MKYLSLLVVISEFETCGKIKFSGHIMVQYLTIPPQASELLDIWGANAGPLMWRLTPPEARKVLNLRYTHVTHFGFD